MLDIVDKFMKNKNGKGKFLPNLLQIKLGVCHINYLLFSMQANSHTNINRVV